MPIKLYVGGLSYNTSDDKLKALFEEHGKVVSAVVIKDRDTAQSKGFGFVEMEEIKDGQNAIKSLNNKEFDGRSIVVNQARPQTDHRPSSFGSYRR